MTEGDDERVVIVAPVGRDAALSARLLAAAGVASVVSPSLDEACERLGEGAGALLLAEEAAAPRPLAQLLALLEGQEPWSDLPLLLCTGSGDARAITAERVRRLDAVGNLTILERPMQASTLQSAAKSALRARRRQYEVRALMAQLTQGIRECDAANEEVRRRVIEVQAANRTKDEFLAMISHELRTPLQAITGWLYLLRAGGLSEAQQARALETIERNAHVQKTVVEELLDVSRITTGKLQLVIQPIDLRQVVSTAVDALRPAADAKGVELRWAAHGPPQATAADPDRLQQVAWNLLSNAMKFTPQGGLIEVTLTQVGSTFELTVRDTGEGIAPDFLPHVFERFRQADTGTTRRRGGLGLGLAIARHIVELHGGTMSADSDGLGQGASFTVRLPSRPRPDAGQEPASGLIAQPLAGLRLLVTEDDPDSCDLLVSVLEARGAQVRSASTAAEALALLRAEVPDVLVSDIGLPDQDGHALLRAFRALGEREKNTPAIALTAYAHASDRARALEAGFARHLAKPVDLPELVAAVADLAGRGPPPGR